MLVLREFKIDERAETFLTICGRKSGIIAFLLTLIGLDPITELRCTRKEALFKQSSIKGQLNASVPIPAITCVETGYSKPFKLLWTALALLIIGTVVSFTVKDGGGWYFTLFFIAAAVCVALYYLQKQMLFSFFNGGDRPIARIVAKGSVIEGVKVDFEKFVQAAALLNEIVCESHAAKTAAAPAAATAHIAV